MSTTIRPVVTQKRDYYISKHRYYELKHYCLQYPEWRRKLRDYSFLKSDYISKPRVSLSDKSDRTADAAQEIYILECKINSIKRASEIACHELAPFIFLAVTEDRSFTYLQTKMNIPVSKNTYYRYYHKFFAELDRITSR